VNELGFKAHLDDIHAAIGIEQLKKLERLNLRRREIVRAYNEAMRKLEWADIPTERDYVKSSYHLYVLRVPAQARDKLIDYLSARGISAGVHYYPNHLYDAYRPYRVSLPVTESVYRTIITLPLYPQLTDAQVKKVIKAVCLFQKASGFDLSAD
jgi:perosamine synthetase